ncbi:ABC transporter permease [Oceanobacillus bengalensis]|uniref:ABC transporter permease n=1 Tax=Oceanobacillus bengalensis TaxID=1435466 RepID=A0A494YXQ4_9BACI|nr:ABC transporter permease [Oceanobacillus bengalensis]RKQ14795.1 ABC transporter permease [Oceanobacillus bengalensis]
MRQTKSIPLYLGIILVLILLVMMVVSIFYTPYDPNMMDPMNKLAAPSVEHPFGTDNFGRDILSRVMEGSQTAFIIGFTAVTIGLVFGFILGASAGYFGGWIDEIISRFIDAMLAFPGILLAIMLISVFSTGMTNTIIALGIMSIPSFARIIRSSFIQYKQFDFVKASIAKGAGAIRIIVQHILPNVVSPILVAAALSFSGSILAESGLSYLGLGVQPPDPSWGRMLKEAQPYIASAPWYVIITGIVITVMVLGFNLLADGLRDRQDKRT